MRLTLDILGRRYVLHLTSQRAAPLALEPEPQGATCGELERAPAWDHDRREPIGFGTRGNPGRDGRDA